MSQDAPRPERSCTYGRAIARSRSTCIVDFGMSLGTVAGVAAAAFAGGFAISMRRARKQAESLPAPTEVRYRLSKLTAQ